MNFKVDASGELAIENNSFVMIEGPEEIEQLSEQRLNTFLGEWFLDKSIGIPYFQKILKKNPNPSDIEAIFIDKITKTTGIKELNSLSILMDPSTREMQIDYNAKIDGDPANHDFSIPVNI